MSRASPSSIAPTALSSPRARRVPFEALPRIVQERFVAATSETFPPWPILRAHPLAPAAHGFIGVSAAAFVAAVILAAVGFGDPFSRLATHPRWALLVFAALCATAAFALLRAIGARKAHNLPFRSGIYLFPSEVIDARSAMLVVHPLADLVTIEQGPTEVRLRFGDRHVYEFPVADEAAAATAVGQVLRARDALEETHNAPSLLGLVDPLYAPCDEIPTVPNTPSPSGSALHLERRLAVGLAVGAALGVLGGLARDAGSDALASRRARARGDVAALSAYAANGRVHVADIRAIDLPLAELRALTETHDIDAWFAKYPAAAATFEAREARTRALLRDLERLTTVTAVRELASRHGIDPGPKLAKLHAEALDRHRDGAVAHLLAQPAACGSGLAIEVVRGVGSLRDADVAVTASRRFAGTPSFPSRYLAKAPDVERDLRATIEARVRKSFPEGCVVPATAGGPRLQITWTPRYTGALVETASPPAVFADVAIDFEVRLLDGGGAELARTTHSISTGVAEHELAEFAATVLRTPGDDAIERAAYARLLRAALSRGADDATTWLLGAGTKEAPRAAGSLAAR